MKNKIIDFIWAKKRYAFWFIDMVAIICVYLFLVAILSRTTKLSFSTGVFLWTCAVSFLVYTVGFILGNCYNISIKYCSGSEYIRIFFVSLCSSMLILVLDGIPTLHLPMLPVAVIIIGNMFITGTLTALRFFAKYCINRSEQSFRQGDKNAIIIGAGKAGALMADEIRMYDHSVSLVGFIDDNPEKLGISVSGLFVLGNRKDIVRICKEYDVKFIYICIPSSKDGEIQKIVTICSETKCKVKILPSVDELLISEQTFSDLRKRVRDVDINDLLERDPITLDNAEISSKISGKTVMVTGGGGSIGSELCRQIAKYQPKKLVVIDIYENNAYDLQNELRRRFPELDLDIVIASVRDLKKLDVIFNEYRPDMVYHAAAHKHVPLMEFAPDEAIKNNVFGTYNSAFCANKYEVDTFTLISTDKAVNPTNVMGATKRICEMIVQAFESVSKTEYVAVRFGNVLGSNGSVIPLFKKQIAEGGPVTLTHKDITRFFMTIPEAAQLVLQASVFAHGGEIFVLDMGKPVKIYHLAEKLIKLSGYTPGVDMKIKIVGLRPGEKLYEELLMDEEGLKNTSNKKIFIGKPIFTDMAVLKENLSKLEDVLDCGDKMLIKKTVSEIVDTYIPDLEHV